MLDSHLGLWMVCPHWSQVHNQRVTKWKLCPFVCLIEPSQQFFNFFLNPPLLAPLGRFDHWEFRTLVVRTIGYCDQTLTVTPTVGHFDQNLAVIRTSGQNDKHEFQLRWCCLAKQQKYPVPFL